MYSNDYIIEQLGITGLPADEQEELINEAQVRIGEAMSENLSEAQQNEFQAIIDGDEAVISLWLDQHVPDYKNAAAYQAFEEDYANDPEHNDPAKLFATIAWPQLNVPNVQPIVDKTLQAFKQELATRPQ
ncbi:MAG TPA: DUF5663 domain-containing protein [Dongiaceae bacterium]|nr:DUF5663 domain-containing protein [Dongiaceae bacterium]